MILLVSLAALGWIGLLVLPWRPWSTREQLDSTAERADLSDVSVLVPARNEADVIATTLRGLEQQGDNLRVLLIDDCSSDGTAERARSPALRRLDIIQGEPLPQGWAGKLWALEQGRGRVQSDLILLLDADIELKPGTIPALKQKVRADGLGLVSLMAELRMQSFWEKLLVPAFIYYFKLVYPFALAGDAKSRLGAAAGGCILLKREALEAIGGFGALRDAIIDDCTLAQKIKSAGYPIWLGLTHSALSLRPYNSLSSIWNMVARSAFTQLRYSIGLLWLTTGALLFFYWVPVAGFFNVQRPIQIISAAGLAAMILSFFPTLKYYGRNRAWALLLPVIATLYLLMTWTSAVRYWRGNRAEWKGRSYAATSPRSSHHQSGTASP